MKTLEKYLIKKVAWPERHFAIHREKRGFDQLSDFFKKNYDAIYQSLEKQGINPTEPPCAFYYSIDEKKKVTDLAAAVPVPATAKPSDVYELVTMPACQTVTTTHHGSYDNMLPAYQQMEEFVKANNLKKGLVIEEYLTDPLIEKDPAKWTTNIFFIVK